MPNPDLTHSRWANPRPSTRLPTSTLDYRHLKGSISNPALPLAPPPLPTENQQSPENRSQQAHPPIQSKPHLQTTSYHHFLKSLRRLKWKSSFLLLSHHRALTQDTINQIGPLTFPITSDTGRANAAEVMFKADFFEFYALLERCLVSLLGCFGVVVTGNGNAGGERGGEREMVAPPLGTVDLNQSVYSDVTTLSNTIIGDSRVQLSVHRFHANVLAALDTPSNPLHPLLGTGKVRSYLGIAKEFRNRWKEVEKEQESKNGDGDEFGGMHRSYRAVLVELVLEEMLGGILVGIEEGGRVAGREVAGWGTLEVEMGEGFDWDGDGEVEVGVDDVMDWD